MIALLLIVLLIVNYVQGQCESQKTCKTCFEAQNCGWCVSDGKCLSGDSRGPTAANACRGVTGTNPRVDRQYWYFSKSQVLSSEAGFPVNPSTVLVYLKPNDPVSVPVEVSAPLPTDQDLDIMFVQDSSGSMADDIQIFRTLAVSLVNNVLKLSKTANTGLASFIEKPVFPQGFPPSDKEKYLLADGSVRNYAYRLETPLKGSSLQLQRALFKLDATSNRDLPEAAFEALGQVMTCDNIGWRPQARKIILVTTDAKYHSSNDPPSFSTVVPNSFPAWDGKCYGVREGVKYLREKNNYPSETQIANLFKSKNIIPIFAIAHNPRDTTSPTEIVYWSTFQRNKIGFGATVKLSDNSDNLIDLIVKALQDINQVIKLLVTVDSRKVIKNVVDANGRGSLTAPPQYTGVQPGNTVEFEVQLSSASAVPRHTTTLTSPGFGSVDIVVTSEFPCKDCAGVDNGSAKLDKCGECNGKDVCVGCDGIANSGTIKDRCGVCGGTNVCDSVCAKGKVDQCGVCEGVNQCLGCDGVPNSMAVYDACGVCGGNNACVGCDGLMPGPGQPVKQLDRCGVCGGNNECVGCDGIAYKGNGQVAPIVDDCGICGGTNKCNCDKNDPSRKLDDCGYCGLPGDKFWNSCVGCDGVPDSGAVYDECGVCEGTGACLSDCDGKPWGERRDVCDLCGGDGSTCVEFNSSIGGVVPRVMKAESTAGVGTGSIIAIAVLVPLTALICAALIAAFFIYKKRTNPYFFLPNGMVDNLNTGVSDSPLYQGNGGGWQENAIGT